jgi:hypothetical protein
MEKKFKIQSWANYNHEEQQYEVNKQKSLTIPDQAMSIKEILSRFARGLDVEGFKPIYDDDDITLDDYIPDPRNMDLAERQEYKEYVVNELNSLNKQINTTETVGLPETENVAVNNAKEDIQL